MVKNNVDGCVRVNVNNKWTPYLLKSFAKVFKSFLQTKLLQMDPEEPDSVFFYPLRKTIN